MVLGEAAFSPVRSAGPHGTYGLGGVFQPGGAARASELDEPGGPVGPFERSGPGEATQGDVTHISYNTATR